MKKSLVRSKGHPEEEEESDCSGKAGIVLTAAAADAKDWTWSSVVGLIGNADVPRRNKIIKYLLLFILVIVFLRNQRKVKRKEMNVLVGCGEG